MYVWWTTAFYEFKKLISNSSLMLLLIGLPLLLIFILGSALDSDIKPAKIALLVEDEGAMRGDIEAFWSDPALSQYVSVKEAGTEEEAKTSVADGAADYAVIVPKDFSQRVYEGVQADWTVYPGRYPEKNIAAEAVIGEFMSTLNLQLSVAAMAASESALPVFADAGKSTTDSSEQPDNASVVKVGTMNAGQQIFESVSSFQYYGAAYLIMFLLYTGMVAAESVIEQRSSGTLGRLYSMPVPFTAVVLGIITGSMFLAALQAVVLLLFSSLAYGVDWGGRYGWIALICLLTTLASVGLAFLLASFKATAKSVMTVFSLLVFIMTFLSGGMIPNINELLGDVDRFTLNYWANESLRMIMQGESSSLLLSKVAVLALTAVLLTAAAAFRLPKVVKHLG